MMELTFKIQDLLNLCDQTIRRIENYINQNPNNLPEYLKSRKLKLRVLKQALSYSVSTTTTMTLESYYSLFSANQDFYYDLLPSASSLSATEAPSD